MIQINGTIKLGQSIDAATRKAMVEMVRASRAEDGCLDYSFASDLADPDTLVLFERWRDQAALEAHGKSAHMAEFQKVMAANPPKSRDLRIYETDDGAPLG
ncbi:putative quinol monooxygenase [Qipengyuania flava]|jgi:quinol monooxygenase YgiN|uniref:putative quinol monooxygenase n=1 Tax=Qipengyuania flava TaxID=192812 RepID=UPI001C6323B8|nr:putative quinol monooxygenase [Qipengyuania flava]QYJ08240.1 antibiotic biosynthesis monooxygenase [Qipengyuania flava]